MKQKLVTILFFAGMLLTNVFSQVKSVITEKTNEVAGKYTKFTVVDQATGYAMGKTPVIYKHGEKAPQVYFTKAPTELVGSDKLFVTINDAENTVEGYWCLAYNPESKKNMFLRRRFIKHKTTSLFHPIIEGDYVIFKDAEYPQYLMIDKDGNFIETGNLGEASRWELIYL